MLRRHALHPGKQRGKIGPVRLERLAFFQRLLPENEFVGQGIGPADHISPEGGFKIPDQVLPGGAVHYDMMDDEIEFQKVLPL